MKMHFTMSNGPLKPKLKPRLARVPFSRRSRASRSRTGGVKTNAHMERFPKQQAQCWSRMWVFICCSRVHVAIIHSVCQGRS